MNGYRTPEPETVMEEGAEHREALRKDYGTGMPHGDEEAGGAVGGGVAGAIVGAIVGGPVGAVVGGAIGAATGATAGVIDEKDKDENVVTREVRQP